VSDHPEGRSGGARQLILGAFAAGFTFLIGLAVGGMASAA
jgi:hypothetical protein